MSQSIVDSATDTVIRIRKRMGELRAGCERWQELDILVTEIEALCADIDYAQGQISKDSAALVRACSRFTE